MNEMQETNSIRPSPSRWKEELREWLKALIIAGILVLLIRLFLFEPFVVSGPSMQPNFYDGDRLIVNKWIYDFRYPKRGEVIVFHATEQKDYIKRVIGLPGDTIKLEGDRLYINGQPVEEEYIRQKVEEAAKRGTTYNDRDFPNASVTQDKVPEGTVFVLGDNRPNSQDSRDIGFIPIEDVIGRAELRFWPLNRIGLIDHGN